MNRKPTLTIPGILRDVDAYHDRHGRWPQKNHEPEWRRLDNALRYGFFGLPGGSSLAQLLAERRGVPNDKDLPRLTVRKILAWVDYHHQQTGDWPNRLTGRVLDQPSKKWVNLDHVLRSGCRRLPGGTSLSCILHKNRGVPIHGVRPPLTVDLILSWVERHRRRTGRWPSEKSGAVLDAPGERWSAISLCPARGHRGLPGGSSLARLIKEHWPDANVRQNRHTGKRRKTK